MLSEKKKSMLIGCEKGYPLGLFKLAMKNFKCELKKYKRVSNVKNSFRGFGGHCLGVKNPASTAPAPTLGYTDQPLEMHLYCSAFTGNL